MYMGFMLGFFIRIMKFVAMISLLILDLACKHSLACVNKICGSNLIKILIIVPIKKILIIVETNSCVQCEVTCTIWRVGQSLIVVTIGP